MLDFSILYVLFRFTNRNKNLREKFRNNKVVSVLAVSVLVLWFGSFFLSLLLGDHSYGNVYNRLQGDPLIIGGMLAVNILLVMTAIWLMWTGLQRERSDCFWGGVLFFLFWTVVRYVDLFSGFGGMLGAAAVFLVCGLFMFGISYVWAIQTRKRAAENTVEVFETPSQPFQIPVWLSKSEDLLSRFWQSERNVLTAYILVVLIQFGILGAMVANEMVPHRSGTTICVATVPVDPRDMFRGDYVTLRYPFSDSTDISGYAVIRNNPTEQTVFVSMQQDGELWKPTGISKSRPKDGVFLRGTVKPYSRAVIYGIESYFVQEGTGKEIENAMRRASGTVVVELNVAPNGKAAVKTVRIK
ncbi:hypothetical protein FACS1894214_4650 [Planctomycetales bacterium]|nr:hypothetical protein FACS1894214_4650 [Planctomycetales bacterium]